MPQQIVIAEHLRIAALLTDERIDELIVAQGSYQIGDVFLGTVENVLPGIDAAFVNIGETEKNGFIHVNDLGPLRLKKATAAITELLEPKQKGEIIWKFDNAVNIEVACNVPGHYQVGMIAKVDIN